MDNSDLRQLKKAASKAKRTGEALYIVTSKDDVETFERWGEVATYLPRYNPKRNVGVARSGGAANGL